MGSEEAPGKEDPAHPALDGGLTSDEPEGPRYFWLEGGDLPDKELCRSDRYIEYSNRGLSVPDERSEAQLHEGDRVWGGSAERSR